MNKEQVLTGLAVSIQARIPVLLWGPPGIGKTASIYALGEALGLPVEVVIASHHDPTDFNGLPAVVGGETRRIAPDWARRLAKEGRGILFLDEISTAPPATQAALLRLILEGVVGDVRLDGVAVVAAANPPELAADGWDLSPPTANRFLHLEASLPNLEAWSLGLVTGDWPKLSRIPRVDPEKTPEERAHWGSLVAGFLRRRPEFFLALPREGSRQGRAWPSPRSWTMGVKALAAASSAGAPEETLLLLLEGAVGEGAAYEFFTFVREVDLPDPEDLLRNPSSYRPPKRGDVVYAILTGVVGAVRRNPSLERYRAAWAVVAKAARESGEDVALPAAQALHRLGGEMGYPPSAVEEEIMVFAPLIARVASFKEGGR